MRRLLPRAEIAAATALVLSACAAPGSEGDGELVWSIEGANLSASRMDARSSHVDVTSTDSEHARRGLLEGDRGHR